MRTERPPPTKNFEKSLKNPLTETPKHDIMTTLKGTRKSPKNQKGIDTMTKMTYVEALNIALTAVADNAEVTKKLTALREQIAKRNSTENRKPTKAQVANEALKAQVVEVLDTTPRTVTEVMALSDALGALSNQKVSALLNALVEDGKVVKTTEKRKSYFALA